MSLKKINKRKMNLSYLLNFNLKVHLVLATVEIRMTCTEAILCPTDTCDNLESIPGLLTNLRSIVDGHGISRSNSGRWLCIFGILLLKKDVICKKCTFLLLSFFSITVADYPGSCQETEQTSLQVSLYCTELWMPGKNSCSVLDLVFWSQKTV